MRYTMNDAHIYAGDDPTPLSTTNTKMTSTPINDSGFFCFENVIKAKYYSIRTGQLPNFKNKSFFSIIEMRLYTSSNLMMTAKTLN